MRVLIIGAGGREHALSWKLNRSSRVEALFAWPGNPGIFEIAQGFLEPPTASFERIKNLALAHRIDLVIIGPEGPLAGGWADALSRAGLKVFGPSRQAAALESSKAFAKEMLRAAGVPTAQFQTATGESECRTIATEKLANLGGVVLKASGLAAGKGVFVCLSQQEVDAAIHALYGKMRDAAATVVIEERLVGREVSHFCFVGPGGIAPLGFAVDYKRRDDQDQGPNTGGMGCYTPVPWLPQDAEETVMRTVVQPTLKALAKRQIPYTGWLYSGLMWTDQGPQVIEFNCRLGDPEAQCLAVWDQRDWLEMIMNVMAPDSRGVPLIAANLRPAVGVVLAGPDYPWSSTPTLPEVESSFLSGGTKKQSGIIFVSGMSATNTGRWRPGAGRIVTCVGQGDTLADARQDAYRLADVGAAALIGAHYRRDIGAEL